MNKKFPISVMLLCIMVASCVAPGNSGTDPQLVSMQQTLDAMQLQIENATVQAQSNPPTQIPSIVNPPTQQPPTNTVHPPTITLTPGKPALRQLPTDTPVVLILPIFELANVIELDNLGPSEDTCGTIRQDMIPFGEGLWQENDHLFGGGKDCSLTFDIVASNTGNYEISLYATYAPDFTKMGIIFKKGQTSFSAATSFLDLYGSDVRPTGPIFLGNVPLVQGETIQLIFLIAEKNPLSSGYKFGLDYLTLKPSP